MTYGPKEYWTELNGAQRYAVQGEFEANPRGIKDVAEYAYALAGFADAQEMD